MQDTKINYIASDASFKETVELILDYPAGKYLGLDTEATGLDCFSSQLIFIQLGNQEFVNVYDIPCISPKYVKYLISLIEPKQIIAHNAKFDLKIIYHNYGIMFKHVYDTMIAESVINAGIGIYSDKTYQWKHKAFYGLDELYQKYSGDTMDKATRKAFYTQPLMITPQLVEYAAKDVYGLFPILNGQLESLKKRKLIKTMELESRLIPVIAEMEYEGISLDKDAWGKLIERAKIEVANGKINIVNFVSNELVSVVEQESLSVFDIHEKFYIPVKSKKKDFLQGLKDTKDIESVLSDFSTTFNHNSNKQMLAVLHFLGVKSKSTDSKELKRDYKQNSFVQLLIDYREWNKKLTSFGENFLKKINPVTNKIHAEFNQVGTGTGRLSSDGPNLQNIDADLGYRASFVAEPGYMFLTSDYSQIELRLATELSQDPIMVKAYLNNDDLHAITASSVFEIPREQLTEEIRKKGKSFNFAILYGTTARGLAYNFGIKEEEATRRLEIFYDTYAELARFVRGTQSQIITRGYSITPLGRKRFFVIPNKWTNKNFKLMYRVFREGFNHIIQGGSADMIKIAMCDIYYDNPFGPDLRLKLTEHDEIVTMAKKEIINDAKIFVEEKMLNAARLVIKTIPVEVKTVIAPYWSKGE